MEPKRRIGILFGGKSVEHEISIRSAQNVFQYIDKTQFTPVLIGITKQGQWHLVHNINDEITSGPELNLSLGQNGHSFQTNSGNDGTGKLDAIFPVLHGTDGEDGSIQGMLQSVNIPCAGSGVLGSAVAMDKLMSKRLLQAAGIPTSKFIAYQPPHDAAYDYEEVIKQLGNPFMIKPISLGSSVGVAKVKSSEDYAQALKDSLNYDQGIIMEQFIEGRELECAVLGNQKPKASFPGEIIISPKYEFYTYDAKYEDPDAVEIKIPAEVDALTAENIQELCVQSYRALACEDFARVDLFLSKDGRVYINEINTIPGFTNSSMFPSLWGQHGIAYDELITQIIDLAIERFERKNQLQREYQGDSG